MNYQVKAILTKRLKKDLIINLVFLMEQNIFLQEYLKIIQYLYLLKITLNILVALLGLICGNLRENGMLGENIENIIKSDSNFAPTFVDHYLLPGVNFNGDCQVNNISVPKKVINIYISYKLNPQL